MGKIVILGRKVSGDDSVILGRKVPCASWVCNRGGFAFVTLNIAVENIQHATHHPSVSEHDDPKNDPSSVTKAKGSVTYPNPLKLRCVLAGFLAFNDTTKTDIWLEMNLL